MLNVVIALVVVALGSLATAQAQLGCKTTNCAPTTTPPAGCVNRAKPRIKEIQVLDFRFVPEVFRIEVGDCVRWKSLSTLHSASENNCPQVSFGTCDTPPPPQCKFETGDFDENHDSSTCYFGSVTFPPSTNYGYYCRVHDNPQNTLHMHGRVFVVPPIAAQVSKIGNNVVVTWSGGGGPATGYIAHLSSNDPTFAASTTSPPDGGASGQVYTDAGEAARFDRSRFYLIGSQ